MKKRRCHFYFQHNKTVSYVWKSYIVKEGYVDCDHFEVRVKGNGRIEEAERICSILNRAKLSE